MDGRNTTARIQRRERPGAPPGQIPEGCGCIEPGMLPLIELSAEHIERITRTVPGGAANIQDIYPLTPLQEGMLFHHMFEQQGDVYLVSTLLAFESRHALDAFIEAFQPVIDRHDILRTAVLWDELPRPVQVVHREASLPVEVLAREGDPVEQLRQRMMSGSTRFDLQRAPLIRLSVVPDAQHRQWYGLLQLHHVICDGQSLQTIVSEVLACLNGHAPRLPVPVQYREHVAQTLAHARSHDVEAFFTARLGDIDEPTAPYGMLEVRGADTRIEEVRQTLARPLATRVRTQASRHRVSPAAIFHAVWALVVSHTSQREDVVFGTVLFGRLQVSGGSKQRVGMFLNTLPLRFRLTDATAVALVEQTQRELFELLRHEQASLASAQRCSGVARPTPLFSALLNYRHKTHNADTCWSTAPGVQQLASRSETTYPLVLSVDDYGDELVLAVQADPRIDAHRLVDYVSSGMQSLLEALEDAPRTPALSLTVLPESERRLLLESFNATQAPYPREKLIHQLFEEQAARTPDAIAVRHAERSLTYAELNGKANQLARALRERSVGPDRLVGLCVERNLDMVVGLLGILKAGGAYVPLDPEYPVERLRYLLTDAAPGVLLTQARLRQRLPETGVEILEIDRLDSDIARHSADDMDAARLGLRSDHLAYVIYTSGSTGLPKGVAIEHRNAVNLIWWARSVTEPKVFEKTLQCTSLNFDLSVYETFVPLTLGGSIEVVQNALSLLTSASDVTLINTVPSAIRGILESGTLPASARVVNLAGEVLKEDLVARIFECSSVERVCNLYGPSETTTYSTGIAMSRDEGFADTIGRPIANTQIHILSRQGQPVPLGVAGEIYIGGAGVARGYLNRPELTAQRFIPDPFSAAPDARLYKTGDLGRWRADGSIEYLGRDDHQVKIRGFRIELGEIEGRLVRHVLLKDAAVIAREDVPGDKRLVAYVVPAQTPAPASSLDIEAIRSSLHETLPEYMVPGAFVQLERLPLTANGKLDRRALPVPELGSHVGRRYEAPQSEVEEVLAAIWQDLLRLERVGRHDNFFELGGHSLLIVQMMARLRRVGLAAELRLIFASPTLADLARVLASDTESRFVAPANAIPTGCETITPQMLPLLPLDAEHIERIVQTVPGGAVNIQDIYPLAPLQEGMLFHHLLNPNSGDTYVVTTLLAVSSREGVDQLIAALRSAMDRHDVLRTAILWEDLPQPVQVVYRRAELPVEEIELDRDSFGPERHRLDLRRAPLMRVLVAADTNRAQWRVVLQIHHIVNDALSLSTLTAEILAHIRGQTAQLPDALPYRNHVAQALQYARTHDAAQFFRERIGDIDEPTAPFGVLDVYEDVRRIEEARAELAPELAQLVRASARQMSVSSATLFHAAWSLVVACTSSRDDVVFGTVLLGRLQGSIDHQRMLGMFINTLPLRLRLADLSVRELVLRTQRELVALLTHEQASLAMAQRCSAIVGPAPLFTALLNYRHSTRNPDSQWDRAPGVQLLGVQTRTNYPITLSIDDCGAGFGLVAQTDHRIDPRRLLGYVQTALRTLVDALEKAPQRAALELRILPDEEHRQLLELFNATAAPHPVDKTIHELFEEQVLRTPDATALIFENQLLTYRELNARANQVARYLRGKGVGPDHLVALCMNRSLEMVTALLGVLKAGGAYMPLDPNYPPDRLQYMVADAAPRLILAQKSLAAAVPATGAEVTLLEDVSSEIAALSPDNFVWDETGVNPEHLVYVIYTSGSTGRPKGTMMPHRAMVNLVAWHRDGLCAGASQRVLQFAALSFDVAAQEVFTTLCTGSTLVLVDEWTRRDAHALADFIDAHSIERLFLPPLMLQSLAEHARGEPHRPTTLRDVITAGEQLRVSPEVVALFRRPAQIRLHNHYGPTETHVVTALTLAGNPGDWPALPTIGRPIANSQIHILDRRRQPVPVGVTGEIYIGGAGVARGYLHRLELTRERFIADPFSAHPAARLYRTGDLGRWRADGTIEYLGRTDHQVKIRGYRIELGEIEAQITRLAQIREAAVIAREDLPGSKRLVAYVVPADPHAPQASLDVEQLRAHLKSVLPDYMVPSAVVTLEKLPLTPSGKLDRRALPAPELDALASAQYEPPQGDLEEILAGVWQGLLHVKRVGRHDNFFELGGHSLLIVQMLDRLRRVGLSVEIRRVFESETLATLAASLMKDTTDPSAVPPNLIPEGCETITPDMLPLVDLEPAHIERIVRGIPGGAANVQDIYPLAPLQEGMLFHHLLNEHGGDTYVVTTVLSVSSRERVNELIEAVQALIERHDALRTAVVWEKLPAPVQVVYRRATLPVQEMVLDEQRELTEQIKDWIEPERHRLDLQHSLPVKLVIVADAARGRWYAALQVHHIVSDAVSQKIMISEIVAHLEHRAHELPPAMPYRFHVAQALAHVRAHDAEAFFRERLKEIDEPTAPFGLLETRGDASDIDEARLRLDSAIARRIRSQARHLGVSAATLFHAAWALVVARTSGRDDIVFGSVLLGRLHGSAGAQRILGMFINTLPLRLRLHGLTAKELVMQTQRELVGLLTHEQASLAMAQRCSSISGSAPLFSALLNYRHWNPDPDAEWSRAAGVEVLANRNRTSYPITLSIDDYGEEFGLVAQSDRRIDPRRLLGYLMTAMQSLIDALGQAPQTPALSLSILPDGEREQLVRVFNATEAAWPREKALHELFEEQVERTPHILAAIHEDQALTYSELNSRANQLAWHLIARGIGPEQPVALCVERGLDMAVGLLGILKAGGAYVPLDPDYPAERLQWMLKDAAPRVLLTQDRLRDRLPSTTAEIVSLDGDWREISRGSAANGGARMLGLRPDHLAYVIYTSGSTGTPKGVAIEHRNATNLVCWARAAQPAAVFGETLHSTSLNFDLSVYELFVPLSCGGTLRIVQNALSLLMSAGAVTLINTVPSAARAILESGSLPASTRVVNLAGEVLTEDLANRIFAASAVEQVGNLYGPSETTTYSTAVSMTRKDGFIASIGTPIANTQIHILDRRRQIVPIGVTGEIYIGGAGVARGYLHRPELTAERFIADPFSAHRDARMYKTGDLGRWRADGTLEYLGRDDHQVKIRGYRIELGEIETQIARHPQVREVAVSARTDVPGDKRIVAYVVEDQDAAAPAGREDIAGTLRDEVVSEWKTVWKETYRKQSPDEAPSFIGWNSSYTGEPIPEAQMQEWLTSTLARIRALRPQRILEIGCGTGLFLQHLAPESEVYVGTDIAASAIDRLQGWMDRREDLRHVQLLHRSATELQDIAAGTFDLVLLNSVVQYFPDSEYLLAALREAARILTPDGKIFVGDVRHLGLLPMFHSAVQLSKASPHVTVGQLRERVARAIAHEKELVIDPQFFAALPGRIPGIRAAEAHWKRGRQLNELIRYRYDVVLYAAPQASATVRPDSLHHIRLAHDAEAQRLIETSDEALTAGALRRQLSDLELDRAVPGTAWQEGEPIRLIGGAPDSWGRYANDPIAHNYRQQLIPTLREYLKARLPDYMIPSAWVALTQLPRTPNGKIDRRALPAPQSRPDDMGEYVAPDSELERALAEIWAQVLQVDRVGAEDDFFELGGHSLLGMKLIARVASRLQIQVPIVTIFQYPTVRQMAQLLEALVFRDSGQNAASTAELEEGIL